jgi:hypothetical protein
MTGENMTLKQKLEKQLEAKLNQWQSEIEKAEAEAKASEANAKAERAEAEARSAAWDKIEDLKKQLEKGEQQLARLRRATEENWDSLKDQISRLVA